MAKQQRPELLQGSLRLLVLQILSHGPAHGYAIARRVRGLTDDLLRVEEGSLYPALHKLESQGLLRADWTRADGGRARKVYRLTAAGRRRLGRDRGAWEAFSGAVGRILGASAEDVAQADGGAA